MVSEARRITTEPLTASAFEPFGWLPVPDTDPSDAEHRLDFAWQDPHVNVISHGPEETVRRTGAISCDRMFRHRSHTQALLVLDSLSVIAVAPPGLDLSSDKDVEAVRAFRLSQHDALVLHRGTWHWGPFPVGEQPVHLYNVQGRRYIEDNECVDLTRFSLWVETGERTLGGT